MTQELKRYGFYRFIKRFTLPLIVVLFLIYCFTDKALWTDFNGYVKSFGAPARQAVLAILMFLAVLYLLRLFRGWFVQKILHRLRLRPSSQEALTSALSYISAHIALLRRQRNKHPPALLSEQYSGTFLYQKRSDDSPAKSFCGKRHRHPFSAKSRSSP